MRAGGDQQGIWRRYWLGDWTLVLVLIILGAIVDSATPRKQDIDPSNATIKYPVLSSTVPTWMLFVIGIFFPAAVFITAFLFQRSENPGLAKAELHRVFLAFALCLTATLLTTFLGKKLAGRPRPNCLALSGYSAGVFTAKESDVNEAFQSFPSGHASSAFACLVFLSLYFLEKLKLNSNSDEDIVNASWKPILAMLPIMLAGWIGITRMTDYWHHPSDVVAGALLGSLYASVSFRYYFTPRHRRRKSSAAVLPLFHATTSAGDESLSVPLASDSAAVQSHT
jgi:membrane-associated phospholipid phosphatase